jgi:uncharacterized membrane protein YphA (DoxX/SURF4 family)
MTDGWLRIFTIGSGEYVPEHVIGFVIMIVSSIVLGILVVMIGIAIIIGFISIIMALFLAVIQMRNIK